MAVNDIAVLRVRPVASGNGTPQVRVIVKWGDGSIDNGPFKATGATVQFQHPFTQPGSYSIAVLAQNTDGDMSAISTIPVIVTITPSAADRPHKWAGLALPVGSMSQALQSLQTTFVPVYTSLSADAALGDYSVQLNSGFDQVVNGTQVIINQPGRLITSGRVTGVTGRTVTLDSQLLDSYQAQGNSPEPAVVELRNSSVINQGLSNKLIPQDPWYFPITFDADLVKASIRMLIATTPKERVMLPTYGSKLHEIPFEQNDTLTFELIRTAVQTAIAQWEPRATVLKIQLSADNNDISGVVVAQLSNSQETFDLNFGVSAP